eukprot:m.43493 g.43493  ORF g.43493 m.43493 type:complete len:147 (-) comp17142_c0_seq2:248-688(-)
MVLARMQSEVVKGFGRGSKDLGCPTANLSEAAIAKLPDTIQQGIYACWAKVEGDVVRKGVMSVGWNPFYQNKTRSAEVHILHKFDKDFYGAKISVVIAKYLRDEMNFDSLDALIKAIQDDIKNASTCLDEPEFAKLKDDDCFTSKS